MGNSKLDDWSRERLKASISEFLKWVPDVGSETMQHTPGRYSDAMHEILSGYDVDLEALRKSFEKASTKAMVICGGVEFFSLCEHHLLPFYGRAWVGYIPKDTVLGLSKIPRLIRAFSQRLQIQERLTSNIADWMFFNLKPEGVAVILEAEHLCVKMRGVRSECQMVTSEMRGVFMEDSSSRAEFLKLIKR